MPPKPAGKVASRVQEKYNNLLSARQKGLDINEKIRNNKMFRNPSIYEKLIGVMGIDERGSNYPKEVFDPMDASGPDGGLTYERLDELQRSAERAHQKSRETRSAVEFAPASQQGGKRARTEPNPARAAAAAATARAGPPQHAMMLQPPAGVAPMMVPGGMMMMPGGVATAPPPGRVPAAAGKPDISAALAEAKRRAALLAAQRR